MTKTIRGSVSKDGTRELGVGFTSKRLSRGDYRVQFDPQLTQQPSVVATPVGPDAAGHRLLTLYDVSFLGFSVSTRKEFESRDSAFNFYASNQYEEKSSD